MANYLFIRIALFVGMAVAINAASFWDATMCGRVRDQLAARQKLKLDSDIDLCIFDCFNQTTAYRFDVTPQECYSGLVQPAMIKFLRKRRPTKQETDKCVNSKSRRRDCKYILIYHFARWYKRRYTTDHGKKFAKFLFFTWGLNPSIYLPPKSLFWEHEVGKVLSEIRFDTDSDITAAIKITSPSDPTEYPIIFREMRYHCYKPTTIYHVKQYCRFRMIMTIAQKLRTLAKGKTQYGSDFQRYKAAAKSNFIPFSTLFEPDMARDIDPPREEENILVLDTQLNELADLAQAGNTQNIETYLEFVPEPYLLEQACKNAKSFAVVAKRCCILEKVVEQLLIYSKTKERRRRPGPNQVVTINFSLNLRAVITELRGEEVFKMMVNSRYEAVTYQQETANLIEGKFGQMKNYFSKLQSFNMQKASADVAYLKGRIDYYQEKSQGAIKDVSDQVGGILGAAMEVMKLEFFEKGVKLAFAILEACNPLKTVFNGGTASDILDAAAEVSEALAGLIEATELKNAWNDVLDLIKSISEGFQKNSEFLSAVGIIVNKIKLEDFPADDEFERCKSTFLTKYNDYTPQVDKEQFTVLTTKLDISVGSGCGLIDGVSGAASNAYVSYIKSQRYCEIAEVSNNRLQVIFEEIYDFQFEFIESMASYLQASTGYHAAQQMITLTSQPMDRTGREDRRRSELRANIVMAHTTYEMQKQAAIQNLCDFLEYKEGGQMPRVCRAATIDVPTLLSYIPKRCRSVSTYVSIPTTTSEKAKAGQINIKQLYAGEEVSFDIPDYNWMKLHNWIGESDNFDAIFFRSFEIFLPTINQEEEKIEVTVRSMGGNAFQKQRVRYNIVPAESLTTVYTAGTRYHPCSGANIENPYNICEDQKLPNLCVMSHVQPFDDEKRLYQTNFARFKIKAKGVRTAQTPSANTPLDVKAKINMCILEKNAAGEKRSLGSPKPGCCSGSTYWNEEHLRCENCPGGGSPNLNGYYCERNQNALFHAV